MNEPAVPSPTTTNPPDAAAPLVTNEEFATTFGEDLRQTLDVSTWLAGEDLNEIYRRTEAEIREAVAREGVVLQQVRSQLFPRISAVPDAPPGAGVHRAELSALEQIHRGLLFNGGVEACDGTRQVHDTLALTIYQIGVSLVSYRGDQGSFGQRLFRRDLRVAMKDPTEEMIALLERRERRSALNHTDRRDTLSDLAQRGIMSYAERAILLRRSTAQWRLGHGNPAPYELVTGSGSLDLMVEATRVIRALVEGHRRFLFVASEPRDRMLQTIGQALYPLEYAIVETLHDQLDKVVANGHYRGRTSVDMTWDGVTLTPMQWIRAFRDMVGPQVVVGVYRASRLAPAQIFYAHRDHADIAAHIAIADSMLQEQRGFPLLIDLADGVCRRVFGRETLDAPVATGYADSQAPWRFLSERDTRQ